MQATLKLLGLALLEILAGPFFFMASGFALSMFGISFEDDFHAYLAMTAVPIILLGGLLAHFWAYGAPIGSCGLQQPQPVF